MTAAEHARVWSKVGERLNKCAQEAKAKGAKGAETGMLQLAILAMEVASAYADLAVVHAAADRIAERT